MDRLLRFRKLKFNWQFGLTLILLFSIPRFLSVMLANQTANYNFTSIIFVAMGIAPFAILNRNGRFSIGLKRSKSARWLIGSFILGMLACTAIFFVGEFLYHDTIENWFVYISRSYGSIPMAALNGPNKHVYFTIFAMIGMTFSPIGEELLYRGLIHQSFAVRFGNNKASLVDSLAFALVHLSHFGLIYVRDQWSFLIVPSLLWITLMFFTSRLFFLCKTKTESLLGAILSHAGFNLAMTYFIFYHIL